MANNNDEYQLYPPEFAEFLFNNLSSAIFLVDTDLRVQKANAAFKALFSREDEEFLNEFCGNSIGCAFAINENTACGTAGECKNCTIRTCLINGFKKTSEVQITYIARDFLTNLYNRRYFFDIAENLFQNAKRNNISMCIAMLDIYFFKQVNDMYGHATGDYVLTSVSHIFQLNLRKADIVSRFGGEEFCILIQCKDNKDAYSVIDKIRLLVEQHEFIYENKKLSISISAGLTKVLEASLEEMIHKADDMLFKAKKAGRNRTEEYEIK